VLFLGGAWPIGLVELIWGGVALRRFRRAAPLKIPRPIDERPSEPYLGFLEKVDSMHKRRLLVS
jgi:hypothetical protein